MKRDRIEEILRVLAIFDALSQSRGEYRLGQIASWATMSRATVDRHLNKMTEAGLLKKNHGIYGGKECRLFSLSDDGQALLSILEQ